MTFYRPIVGRQSPDICHLSPAARRTDGRSRATVPTYISIRLHYAHHILCHGVCGNASVVADGGEKRIVQLLEPYYLYWMRGHPKVVWSVDGRETIENTYRLLFFFLFCFCFLLLFFSMLTIRPSYALNIKIKKAKVPFVNCRQFMYLVISLLVLRAGYGI